MGPLDNGLSRNGLYVEKIAKPSFNRRITQERWIDPARRLCSPPRLL